MPRIRTILSLAASAAAVLALAAPAQAVPDDTYVIREPESGRCLTVLGDHLVGLGNCSIESAWKITNRGDGTVQIAESRNEERCLRIAPPPVFPPFTDVGPCGTGPDRWRIRELGPEGAPVLITEAFRDGGLAPQGDRTIVRPGGGVPWDLLHIRR
ncbi:RICIN domain-containing protein [Streptomyces sp. NPDC051569]|uniref:RICIN domain-containing protein n=1 Tax=Streptomyces sp. NPDC051569 TaxID=3365661 RepID=UPI0037AA7A80